MKVIFMGTPDFSVPSLQYLINSKHDLIAVFTQPDKKQGRGQKIKPSPVKSLANRYNIKVLQPSTLKGGEFLDCFFDADVVIVIAYGLILPVEYLNAPKYGCLNIHASLLPRWRGAAPIQRAIAAGDKLTGVCLMKMNEGLDTGPVFSKKTCVIEQSDTSITLADKLSKDSISLLHDWFINPDNKAVGQLKSGVEYAKKISKSESVIKFDAPAQDIYNKFKAFLPWPGVGFFFKDLYIKIHDMEVCSHVQNSPVASIVCADKTGLIIQARFAQISIKSLQLPNKKKLFWYDFYCGLPEMFVVGEIVR